jgi:broad specificity phosphatase PhoE
MDFGAWDGLSWTDIEASDGTRFQEWMAAWTTTRAPGGESLDDLLARADEWLRDFQASLVSQAPSGPVVVVAHAGWIRALLTRVMDRPISSFFELPVDYAHATVLQIRNGAPVVVASNVQSFT